MTKKYLLLSALGHSLLLASFAVPSHASRSPANEMTCQDIIDQELKPFQSQVNSIWVKDNLFIYTQVARIFSHELLDRDPGLRAKIEDYKHGKPSPTTWELQALLNAKASQTAGYADSLAWLYGDKDNAKWFTWHYPVIHVGEMASLRVYFSIAVDIGEYQLNVDLGPTSAEEDTQLRLSAARIVALRSGMILPHTDMFSPEYGSEQSYLTRKDSTVPKRCRAGLYPRYASLDLSAPPVNPGRTLKDEAGSRGIGEGHPITGYPTSEYAGSRQSGGSQGGGSQSGGSPGGTPAPAPAAPETPEAPLAAPAPAVAPGAPAETPQ